MYYDVLGFTDVYKRQASGMQVSIDGFMRFADYFFDGFFVDWMVLDRIQQSTEQVK